MYPTARDYRALTEVSPGALSAYIRSLEWEKVEEYGDYSDVYVGQGLPEIVVPRTKEIGDYAIVMAQLLDVFSRVEDLPTESVLRRILYADRDVIRARVESDGDGTLPIEEGVELLNGSRNALLATVCSWSDRRPVLRPGQNTEATRFLRSVRLGQTEEGSYVVTLLPPVISPMVQLRLAGLDDPVDDVDNDPYERKMTRHFSQALGAVRKATEDTVAGESDAFAIAVESGVSANLCEALVQLVGPYPKVDVSVSWAVSRPVDQGRTTLSFFKDDVPVLQQVARRFREAGPRPEQRIFGKVVRLARNDQMVDGTVTVRALIDGRAQSIMVVLNQTDYDKAINAHKGMVVVGLEGDLERVATKWHLRNPKVIDVITDENGVDDEDPIKEFGRV